jgi:predicted extracellular nuclease
MGDRGMKNALLVAVVLFTSSSLAQSQIRITEWMYNGLGTSSVGEFVELTNVGGANVDLTGWSFDDSSRVPGSTSLSSIGLVVAGESVILTDVAAATFRTNWSLSASVKIAGGNTNNLGRADEINIYDATQSLVDRLTYDDQTLGGPRTQAKSGVPVSPAALGANNPILWELSVSGVNGAVTSSLLEVGSPGSFAIAPIPEPATLSLLVGGLCLAASRRR